MESQDSVPHPMHVVPDRSLSRTADLHTRLVLLRIGDQVGLRADNVIIGVKQMRVKGLNDHRGLALGLRTTTPCDEPLKHDNLILIRTININ